MPGEYYYRGERGKKFGKLLPIPTFAVSSRSMKEVVNFLKSLEKEENLTAGDAHLRIATYAPIFQEGADIVPNYAEEVKIWADAGEAVSWSSTLDRAYEIIKTVSMEKMDHSSLERAKFMVSQAVRTSMTQPLKSKFDQIDADTEEALMQCYGLSEPPTTATTTTTTTQTMTLETVEEEVEIEDELAEEVDPPDDHEADETGAGSWVQLGGGGDTACKSVSVMSSGRRKEFGAEELKNRVEFRLGGASLELNETEGIHMVTVDPDTQGVLSQSVYTRGGWLFKGAVNGETELVRDLGDLPTGTVVLIAVKGDGMAGLKEETVLALRRAGAKAVRNARPEEGYIFVGQIGGRPAAEKIGRLVRAQALLPCRAGSRGRVPERASLLHEASKCLPVMWDKVAVGGPPFPQVTDAQTDFPRDDLRVVDTLVVHPICSRFGVALNHWEMSHAPYPNPNEWAPSMKFDLRTGWNALNWKPQVAQGSHDGLLPPPRHGSMHFVHRLLGLAYQARREADPRRLRRERARVRGDARGKCVSAVGHGPSSPSFLFFRALFLLLFLLLLPPLLSAPARTGSAFRARCDVPSGWTGSRRASTTTAGERATAGLHPLAAAAFGIRVDVTAS
ncbi:unnamed protein product [Prorocentrum cordatum]|uniref:ILEI/PANDER domain-containing protein n=1 Tax=Prorocentrum cordatum TaxID=2364126 RepID=A0ABN9Q088_9DINO|nr:unnamed protein product [Polarella glacialis]